MEDGVETAYRARRQANTARRWRSGIRINDWRRGLRSADARMMALQSTKYRVRADGADIRSTVKQNDRRSDVCTSRATRGTAMTRVLRAAYSMSTVISTGSAVQPSYPPSGPTRHLISVQQAPQRSIVACNHAMDRVPRYIRDVPSRGHQSRLLYQTKGVSVCREKEVLRPSVGRVIEHSIGGT
jgi:hypothetical protein